MCYQDDQIVDDEMDGVCSMYGREQEGRENFGGKTLKKQHYWKSYA
jgi:hypothetical protein